MSGEREREKREREKREREREKKEIEREREKEIKRERERERDVKKRISWQKVCINFKVKGNSTFYVTGFKQVKPKGYALALLSHETSISKIVSFHVYKRQNQFDCRPTALLTFIPPSEYLYIMIMMKNKSLLLL